ncbi:hypothetical protein ACFO4O_01060 [Glaciecola siphonariae]|uniref:TPR repeat-containing protein n=1 Tax=Glaciecola siphonariae TaxID=521012 RepID=A0ABV9LRK1_9ALTE
MTYKGKLHTNQRSTASGKLRLMAWMLCSLWLGGCATMNSMLGSEPSPDDAPERAQVSPLTNDSQLAQTPAEQATKENVAAEEASAKYAAVLARIGATNLFEQNKRSNKSSDKQLLTMALDALQNNQAIEAKSYIEQAMKGAPRASFSSNAHVLAGDIYFKLWQLSGEDIPSKPDASVSDGQALNAMKNTTTNSATNWSLAREHFDAALIVNTHNYKAANRRAKLHRMQGEFAQALALYNQAIASYPGYFVSYRNRGLLQDLYLGNKVDALQDYSLYISYLDFNVALIDDPDLLQNSQLFAASSAQASHAFADESALRQELKKLKGWRVDLQRQLKAKDLAFTGETK